MEVEGGFFFWPYSEEVISLIPGVHGLSVDECVTLNWLMEVWIVDSPPTPHPNVLSAAQTTASAWWHLLNISAASCWLLSDGEAQDQLSHHTDQGRRQGQFHGHVWRNTEPSSTHESDVSVWSSAPSTVLRSAATSRWCSVGFVLRLGSREELSDEDEVGPTNRQSHDLSRLSVWKRTKKRVDVKVQISSRPTNWFVTLVLQISKGLGCIFHSTRTFFQITDRWR